MAISTTYLTIKEFFELPESDRPLELVDGQAIAKQQQLIEDLEYWRDRSNK
ncbi:MAG: hypothetical protein QNJ55_19125 [Xenococcus sp. MO_188.B8]|nr:hypothetical protein [Xenococcus sp. MO_188.B8]